MVCACDLCQSRTLGCHPLELYFGPESPEAFLVRTVPGKPIYLYEEYGRFLRSNSELPVWAIESLRERKG